MKPSVIDIGSKVVFKYNGKREERVLDFIENYDVREIITPNSPVGKAMLGKLRGDKFDVAVPEGKAYIEILEVL